MILKLWELDTNPCMVVNFTRTMQHQTRVHGIQTKQMPSLARSHFPRCTRLGFQCSGMSKPDCTENYYNLTGPALTALIKEKYYRSI